MSKRETFDSRGNVVEPLSRILEPVSVRHLDIDSPANSPKTNVSKEVVPRRQMASQLVRLGSIDKDPGVIGPLVWDLHCQRIKDGKTLKTKVMKPDIFLFSVLYFDPLQLHTDTLFR